MAFKIKGSHVLAIALAGGLGLWMMAGDVKIGGQSDNGESAVPIAEREAERSAEIFKVRHVPLMAQERQQSVLVRGRTRADAVVTVRAETAGVLEKRLVSKGQNVKKGDLVCVIERGAREASLAQAKAQLAQAETEYNANAQLKKKGFASQNRLTALRAALDAAKASVASAQLELERTEVRANAAGIVQDPIAEAGDMLSMGGTCVTLIDNDPMLFTGQVSERDIGRIATGMEAEVKLITGDTATGTIRYIAPSADAQTRTFAVEIEFEPGSGVRDGMTAEARIVLDAGKAFRVSPSWVTLADDGTIGIRIVKEDNTVAFVPVTILSQEKDGFWVTGPSEGDRVITLGQEYVVAGEKVETAPDERYAGKLAAAEGLQATGTAQ
ncbi:efflux RND transporter periplasmic adaptor subunit [Salaquimonas pukyongi]|uniref:efflux RND transporter periplasmic adaptor subunit n=1 Tax=Salaquimonas pukyongi TaxID=2712698 RepID=UPI00096BBD1E|nr:efflux RND transporter periplasmic adaptor subunit [Salaquimonas pukyongi]